MKITREYHSSEPAYTVLDSQDRVRLEKQLQELATLIGVRFETIIDSIQLYYQNKGLNLSQAEIYFNLQQQLSRFDNDKTAQSFLQMWLVQHEVLPDPLIVQQKQLRLYPAIRNAFQGGRQAAAELKHQATHDPLTSLLNRNGLSDILKRWTREILNLKAGLILIDIDNFKMVNDLYGHVAGDEVLRELARVLETMVRDGDVVARTGGEEFTVVIPGISDVQYLESVYQRIAAHLADEPIPTSSGDLYITISAGGTISSASLLRKAFVENDKQSVNDTIKQADTALYTSKASGKNQITLVESNAAQTHHPQH